MEFGGFEEIQAVPNARNAESKAVTGRERGCRGREGPDHSVCEWGGGGLLGKICQGFGTYPKGKGQPQKGFKQKSSMT